MSLIMDPLNLLLNKENTGKQGSAQMIEQPSVIETAVIPEPSRRVLYLCSWSNQDICFVIKDGQECVMCY